MKRNRLVIRYDSDVVVKRFRRFAIDFETYEAALKVLLDLAEDKGYVLRK